VVIGAFKNTRVFSKVSPTRPFDTGCHAPAIDLLADLDLVQVELRPGSVEHEQHRVHDLRADPVTASDGHRSSHHRLGWGG
jgi:hypothetical protein